MGQTVPLRFAEISQPGVAIHKRTEGKTFKTGQKEAEPKCKDFGEFGVGAFIQLFAGYQF